MALSIRNPFSEKIARNTSAERGLRFLGSRRDLDARSFVRSYVRSLVRRENFSATRKFRRREIFRKKNSGSNVLETLNGRLPLEDGSDRPQTWPKLVSDDPRHFIFRRPKKIF